MSKGQGDMGVCYSCQCAVPIDKTPVPLHTPGQGHQLVPPKFDAPLICSRCREAKHTLKIVRVEMNKYLGPEIESEGFEG